MRKNKKIIWMGGDHTYIVKISLNTEKSLGDPRKLIATQTLEKACQLKLI